MAAEATDAAARPLAIMAEEASPRTKPSNYPAPFAARMAGRLKRPLGDLFGLESFGVNFTTLAPGAVTALHHAHSAQDEFIYVLAGRPTLIHDHGEVPLAPGMAAGFRAGEGAHHLANRTEEEVVILEVGDRGAGDTVSYPRDDLVATQGEDGRWRFTRKNGTPW